MEYISPEEAAKKWEVNIRRVQSYCAEGKIPGAFRMGRQWMIPASAERPSDGRKKLKSESKASDYYRFPVLVYFESYSSQTDLNDEEKELFRAQLLNLKSDYYESFLICKKLIESEMSYIRFGAYCTNVFNCLLLGLSSELNICMNEMEKIKDAEKIHSEDYKMLIASCRFQYTYDTHLFNEIDITRLSSDALPLYELVSIITMIFVDEPMHPQALRVFSAMCRQAEINGCVPASMVMHGLLATLCERNGDNESKIKHIQDACRIGYSEGLYTTLSKYSNFNHMEYHRQMNAYGHDFARKIEKIRNHNTQNFILTFNATRKMALNIDFTTEQGDVILLVCSGFSMKKVSMMKNISVSEIKKTINAFMQKTILKQRQNSSPMQGRFSSHNLACGYLPKVE